MTGHTRLARAGIWTMAVLTLMLTVSGCQYSRSRWDDFADIGQLGIGVTAENPRFGYLPSALGVYAQVTDFIPIGYLTYEGYSAEWDGRGAFAGKESRDRSAVLLFDQYVKIDQNYEKGSENYFKKTGSLWEDRMASDAMDWLDFPAKDLSMSGEEFWGGGPAFPRGWQYWETIGAEVAVCEPFLLHHGFTVRAYVDPSEIFDFVLGLATLDFKKDDLTVEEFNQINSGDWDATTAATAKWEEEDEEEYDDDEGEDEDEDEA